MYAWCMRAAGWFVEAVSNGAEALYAVPSFEPDIIVVDLQLPVVGGIDVIRRLKREEDTKHVPIVAVTGYGGETEMQVRAAGCDAFVTKPCSPDALRELVEATVKGDSAT